MKLLLNIVSKNEVLMKFVSVGLVATFLHAAIYYLLVNVGSIDAQISNLIGYFFAFTVSYLGQRKWTFNHVIIESENKARIKFFISSLLSLSLNVFWVYIVDSFLNISANYSLLGIILLTPIITFLLLKLWVFKESKSGY